MIEPTSLPATPPDPSATTPPDEAERQRIRSDLDATLFVEAGAGAGKTSSLVARIVNLVRSGVPVTGIAAITFTEKAAAELRSRTRQRLESDGAPHTSARHSPGSTMPRSARYTRSPDGSCSTSRSMQACRPASLCSTNSRAASHSRNGGTICSTTFSTKPNQPVV